jgi:hypothetical protein
MIGSQIPDGFVPLRAVFYKIAVGLAANALREKARDFSDEIKESVFKYRQAFLDFEMRAAVYKADKAGAKARKWVGVKDVTPPRNL